MTREEGTEKVAGRQQSGRAHGKDVTQNLRMRHMEVTSTPQGGSPDKPDGRRCEKEKTTFLDKGADYPRRDAKGGPFLSYGTLEGDGRAPW